MSYNGWKNWETWNVALWINNDEGLYNTALECVSYKAFRESLRELSEEAAGDYGAIAYETPDGVAWNDSALDLPRLDEMLKENREEEADDTPAHGGTGGAPEDDHLEPQHFTGGAPEAHGSLCRFEPHHFSEGV